MYWKPGRAAVRLLLPLLLLPLAATAGRAQEPSGVDTAPFDSLLALYVHDGKVDYAGWKQGGTEGLDAFLASAASYDLTATMAKEPKAALLTNIYNAWVIRQVLEHYPVESVREIPGFFDKNSIPVAGEERTLNDIDAVLAGLLSYMPYFNLLLVPGAAGAPALPSQALTPETYTDVLTQTAWTYLGQEHKIWFDKETKILHVPPCVGDHLDLYDNMQRGIGGFAGNYLTLGEAMEVGTLDFEIAVDDMDWSLNAAASSPPQEPGKPGTGEEKEPSSEGKSGG